MKCEHLSLSELVYSVYECISSLIDVCITFQRYRHICIFREYICILCKLFILRYIVYDRTKVVKLTIVVVVANKIAFGSVCDETMYFSSVLYHQIIYSEAFITAKLFTRG